MASIIKVIRDTYYPRSTIGKLYIIPDNKPIEYFCETLEDTVRPPNIKVKGNTAIASDIFLNVGIRYSPKFKRDCLVLYNYKEGDRYYIRNEYIEFGEVMFHGGNDFEDTEGCPLVAYRRIDDKIQETAEKNLFNRVKELMKSCEVHAIFKNFPQKS